MYTKTSNKLYVGTSLIILSRYSYIIKIKLVFEPFLKNYYSSKTKIYHKRMLIKNMV